MTPEAQRIAIAEVCGWAKYDGPEKFQFYSLRGMYARVTDIPNYLSDLNAIHEAEMSQIDMEDGTFLFNFRTWLHTILGHDGTLAIHATAVQHSEAFLRSLNLWDDAK